MGGGCCGGGSGASSEDGGGGFLNWGTSVQYVFFKWWTASTPTGFVTANILLVILSFLYEGLVGYRARLDTRLAARNSILEHSGGPFTLPQNVARSALHALTYYASQVLMMVFMAYNGYFCASLVFGRFLGYLFFSIYAPAPKSMMGERPQSCCGG